MTFEERSSLILAVKTDSRDARLTDIFDAAVKRSVKDLF